MARVREPPMASNDDSASLLVDEWSPPPAATPAASSPLRRLLHGGKKETARPATTTRSHDVKRFICSPFAAVFRAMSCARDAAVSTCDEQQPGNNGNTAGVAAERRREARMRRPSLEQLLRMEAPPPGPPASARPDHHLRKPLLGKPREAAAAPYEVISSAYAAAVKGKEQEPLFPSPQSHFVSVSDDADDDGERRRTTIVPVKLEGAGGGPGRQTNAKRLVVVFASLRACSRVPRINDGNKVAAAGRAPGKAELFYYRPIPMGRRCRVQHLEESPYGAGSDLSSLLDRPWTDMRCMVRE